MIGILIIGDEILTGRVADENQRYIVHRLRSIGYRAGEVRIVGDNIEAIGEAFAALAQRCRYVVSSGGIGPTHDDVTFAGLAHGFGVDLFLQQDMCAFLEHAYRRPRDSIIEYMATLPRGTTLTMDPDGHWPLIAFRNCFVLPGFPSALRVKVEHILQILPHLAPHHEAIIYLDSSEISIAGQLTELQLRYPSVAIGSYPNINSGTDWRVRLIMSAAAEDTLQQACTEALQTFSVLRYELPGADAAAGTADA